MNMEPLRLGPSPHLPTPHCYLMISNPDPIVRCDLYLGEECQFRQEAIFWREWLVIGLGQQVHMVNMQTGQVRNLELEG